MQYCFCLLCVRARVCVCEYVSVFVCLHRYLTKWQASLTLQDSASAINGTDLALEIWDVAKLDAQQRLCESMSDAGFG